MELTETLRSLALAALGLALSPALLPAQTADPEAQVLDLGLRGRQAPARVVDILLDAKTFYPIDLYHNGGELAPLTWRGCKAEDVMSRLKRKKPAFITAEPAYQGSRRLYGSLTLGSRKDNRFYFAMDVISPDRMLMHFDFNRNGRLDDDGPPLKSQGDFKAGENGFATLIELPWTDLVDDSPYHGKFLVWFFINGSQWANMGFSHASHTQLKGTVKIGGVPYTVVIADQAEDDNDAILTNDGLFLQRGQGELRRISDEEAKAGVLVDGKRTVFRVRYAKGSELRAAQEAAAPASGEGTIEFTVRPRAAALPPGTNRVLMQASDGAEHSVVGVRPDGLTVFRDFAPCIRSFAMIPYGFQKGVSTRMTLKWKGASTGFFIDGRALGAFHLSTRQPFTVPKSSASVQGGRDFEVSDLVVSPRSDLPPDPADREFQQSHPCPGR